MTAVASSGSGRPPPTPPLWQQLDVVAGLVEEVERGRSMTRLLEAVASPLRGGAQALGFHVLRHLGTARGLRQLLASRRPAPPADALLCSALALLLPQQWRPYAPFVVVDQTIEAAKRRRMGRPTAAFLNACLRRYLRDPASWMHAALADPVARWNHPRWWIERLQRQHPQHWTLVLEAAQHPAPLDLRVHVGRITVAEYCRLLARAGTEGQPLGAAAVRLPRSLPAQAIPGHSDGLVSVQSVTAQRAAPLLLADLPVAAPRILDACAAPGGKTAHLLELMPAARVTALEVDPERSRRITQNLERLGLRAHVQVADAGAVVAWWDGTPFDAILLDAPCTASGIARRHPDVRWLRRESDVRQFAQQQDRLLEALWPLLAPGGRLLYCTCSVFREEGEERVQAFLGRNADAEKRPAPGHVLPILPGAQVPVGDNQGRDEDGFFFALLHKRTP